VGVLGTVRTDADAGNASSWLHLPGPDVIQRITLHPLNIGVLREVLSKRLERSFTRPAMIRIHEVSGGNPFYALELGRVMNDDTSSTEMPLPTTLSELVRARIDTLDTDAGEALLAVACLATPTVDLVARATGTNPDGVVALLEGARNRLCTPRATPPSIRRRLPRSPPEAACAELPAGRRRARRALVAPP
jgi:hypothetical protein